MDERAQRRAAGASSHAPLTAQGGRPRESSVWTDGTDEVPMGSCRAPSAFLSCVSTSSSQERKTKWNGRGVD